ncbi:nematocyst expressed protein 4-like isoform X1 [Eupeodes corollae]|uniref:nematocyst expressed protein 4-like isoform X1 n=1 Tax=Eupeodes corollae TaxID=290404 RepID=UPI002491CE8B|nr:nematocyst expressed protein 4-like isoform X1 [Eupeodes corollae]
MRQQIVRYIINFILKVLLFGLSTRFRLANGFGFNFTPAAPPAIPLSVAANSPFPFPFPAPCGAAPFCPPPTIVVAPPFGAPPPFFPPPAYPPPYPYPYPPSPYPYPQPDPYPKHTLFSTILDAILSRKTKSMPMSMPPPPMMQHQPQHSRIQVHLIKDSGGHDHRKQNHHQNHQNHWRDEKPRWN